LFYWAFKRALLLHIPLCISWTFLVLAFLIWIDAGKPRTGLIYEQMYRTRATFKLALLYCQRHKEQVQADACARSYFDADPQKF